MENGSVGLTVDDRLASGLRNYWYPIYRSEDLGARPVGVKRLNEDLVLWRDSHGAAHCFADYCAHRAARLSLGRSTATSSSVGTTGGSLISPASAV